MQGESNTLLLLGAPGSSKSAIVSTALSRLREMYGDQEGSYYTIKLDGEVLMDDKIALKEIARQLALEMNVEMEKVPPLSLVRPSSYAPCLFLCTSCYHLALDLSLVVCIDIDSRCPSPTP